MSLRRMISRQLAVPAVALLVLLAAGAVLIWAAQRTLAQTHRSHAARQAEHRQAQQRLVRLTQEEHEVHDNVEVYRRLKDLRILGEERRLEWIDAMARIRGQRELLDLRYQVERQKLLKNLPGVPAGVELRSSSMNVELSLLHETDLLRFLADLRASGNAHYSIRHCTITRIAPTVPTAALAPHLRGVCQIDLITLLERKGSA